MNLKLLCPEFSVCKFSPESKIPLWALESEYLFLSRTSDELSVFCPTIIIPSGVQSDGGWRCFRVDGDLEFEQIGVVSTVSTPLANAGISLFLVSTHDRDYVFIRQEKITKAIEIYKDQNFQIS